MFFKWFSSNRTDLAGVHWQHYCCRSLVSDASLWWLWKRSEFMLWRGLEGVVGAGRPTCSFVLFLPSLLWGAMAVTSLLGGWGHHLLSVPLSAPSWTETVRSNLYRGTAAKQLKNQGEKKENNSWWLYNYTVNAVPPPAAFFLFIPILILSFSFFPARVSAN